MIVFRKRNLPEGQKLNWVYVDIVHDTRMNLKSYGRQTGIYFYTAWKPISNRTYQTQLHCINHGESVHQSAILIIVKHYREQEIFCKSFLTLLLVKEGDKKSVNKSTRGNKQSFFCCLTDRWVHNRTYIFSHESFLFQRILVFGKKQQDVSYFFRRYMKPFMMFQNLV